MRCQIRTRNPNLMLRFQKILSSTATSRSDPIKRFIELAIHILPENSKSCHRHGCVGVVTTEAGSARLSLVGVKGAFRAYGRIISFLSYLLRYPSCSVIPYSIQDCCRYPLSSIRFVTSDSHWLSRAACNIRDTPLSFSRRGSHYCCD